MWERNPGSEAPGGLESVRYVSESEASYGAGPARSVSGSEGFSLKMKSASTAFTLALVLLAARSGPVKATVWRVDVDGSGDAPTLQAAIDSAASGDTVLAGPGHYTWSNQGGDPVRGFICFLDRKHHITFMSEDGPETTILDAEQGSRAVYVQGMNHITFEGFSVTGGIAPAFGEYTGGGYFNHISGDTIRNCIFTGNRGRYGGAIYSCGNGYVTLVEDCTFTGNTAERYGGAAALCCNSVSSVFRRCVIRGNGAGEGGGGVEHDLCPLTFEECVVAENECSGRGGAVCGLNDAATIITSCTIAFNEAPDGAGICIFGSSSLTLRRSILAGNHGLWLSIDEANAATIGCNDIHGNSGGDDLPAGSIDEGFNIFLDPQFCGVSGSGNYHLQSDSPCLPVNHPGGLLCQIVGARPDGCGTTGAGRRSWGGIKLRPH